MNELVVISPKEQARRIQDLPPNTMCSFSPDSSSEQDAHWSAVGIDEDLTANIIFSTSTPGFLKLWPWVNQVRCLASFNIASDTLLRVTVGSIDRVFSTSTRDRDAAFQTYGVRTLARYCSRPSMHEGLYHLRYPGLASSSSKITVRSSGWSP